MEVRGTELQQEQEESGQEKTRDISAEKLKMLAFVVARWPKQADCSRWAGLPDPPH